MRKFKLLAVGAAFLALAACNGFTLVEPNKEIKIADSYTMMTGMEWNRVQRNNVDVWTLDGVGLQFLSLKNGIKDGEKISVEDKAPVYKKNMTTLELLDLVKSELVATNRHNIQVLESRPVKVGDHPGFVTEISFEDDDGLEYRTLVKGFVRDEKLNLMSYIGLTEYYYERGRADVSSMMESMKPL